MRLEFINRVKENDILGKSILTSDGKILLRGGIKLTENYIKKLKSMGVFYIYVEDDRLDDIEVEDEKLTELKQVTMKSMSNVVKGIHSCRGKQIRESLVSIEELINYIIDLGDVNKSLYDIKTYDNYTYLHCLDTCVMGAFLGISSGLDEYELRELGIGAVLHDIGKTKVPIKIINKKGKLTDEEFNEIKNHTIYGGEMLKKNFIMSYPIIDIVEQHHERIDGRGYPYGLKGNEISKFAKIVSICDVYDAVSTDRSYRKRFGPNESYELILSGAGTSFDKDLVQNLRKHLLFIL
ncbi:cyclic di-GMP phosphodiesterase response regulator RpfG [Clostridium acetireducens DSM 10703]|uniref:Cyclic di-GMP phosphodiesterase response regulator RpfG n=1 Tax=Clostridium acetireducens DSM 10703 TaxID=1121290 RepID=A0A1E8EYG8_9CLOT|nr:cyclic di-GMP phosphodiesterase response regulator RpfG [Clostridium acetireducens DSM 10703]